MLLILSVYLIPSVVGVFVLAAARRCAWTVPVWSFLLAPWPVIAIDFIVFVLMLSQARSRRGDGAVVGFPIQGPMAGLGAVIEIVVGTFWLLVWTGLLVALWSLRPQKQCWTPQATRGAWMAAALSVGWSVMVSRIDGKTLPPSPYDTFTVTVPDKFLGRAWIFEDKADGVPPKWVLGRAHYTVPPCGVLITRDAGPLERHARDLKSIWVTVRTASGDIIPFDRSSQPGGMHEPLYYAWQRHTRNKGASTGYHELFVGDATAVSEFRLPPVRPTWIRASPEEVLLWAANAKILFSPFRSTINGDPVEWTHVAGDSNHHTYETTWTQLNAPDPSSLRVRLDVRTLRSRRNGVEVTVENVGAALVDGWEITYDAPYDFVSDGSFTYYRGQMDVEARPAFIPLASQSFARHTFFRKPNAKPINPGESDTVRRGLICSIAKPNITLEWAKSLSSALAN